MKGEGSQQGKGKDQRARGTACRVEGRNKERDRKHKRRGEEQAVTVLSEERPSLTRTPTGTTTRRSTY